MTKLALKIRGGATVMGVPEKNSIRPFLVQHEEKKGAVAIMADGSIRFIPATISDTDFKALCTIHGGEKVDLDKETALIAGAKEAVLRAKE